MRRCWRTPMRSRSASGDMREWTASSRRRRSTATESRRHSICRPITTHAADVQCVGVGQHAIAAEVCSRHRRVDAAPCRDMANTGRVDDLGGQMHIFPAMASGSTATFGYLSRNCVNLSGGGGGETFMNDDGHVCAGRAFAQAWPDLRSGRRTRDRPTPRIWGRSRMR